MKTKVLILAALLFCLASTAMAGESWFSKHHRAAKRSFQRNGKKIKGTATTFGRNFNRATNNGFAKGYAGTAAGLSGHGWLAGPAYVVGKKTPEAVVGVGMSGYYYGKGFLKGRSSRKTRRYW